MCSYEVAAALHWPVFLAWSFRRLTAVITRLETHLVSVHFSPRVSVLLPSSLACALLVQQINVVFMMFANALCSLESSRFEYLLTAFRLRLFSCSAQTCCSTTCWADTEWMCHFAAFSLHHQFRFVTTACENSPQLEGSLQLCKVHISDILSVNWSMHSVPKLKFCS